MSDEQTMPEPANDATPLRDIPHMLHLTWQSGGLEGQPPEPQLGITAAFPLESWNALSDQEAVLRQAAQVMLDALWERIKPIEPTP